MWEIFSCEATLKAKSTTIAQTTNAELRTRIEEGIGAISVP